MLLKKMVVLSSKITILISWSHICIPLIILSALMKLESTLAAILYNSIGSRHPWWTNVRIKGSDRRPFILIIDSILVYATLMMWMNLSLQMQSKRDKINSKETTERFLFNLFDSSVMSQIVQRVCTVKLFYF